MFSAAVMCLFITRIKKPSEVSTILPVAPHWLGLGSRVHWNHTILWVETDCNSAARRESLYSSKYPCYMKSLSGW